MAKKTVDINVGKSKFSRNQKQEARRAFSSTAPTASSLRHRHRASRWPRRPCRGKARTHAADSPRGLFSTASSYQTAMEFHVVYGNRPLAKDCETSRAFAFEIFAGRQPGFRKSRSISTWIKQACSPLASTISIEKTEAIVGGRTRFPRGFNETAHAAEGETPSDAAERERIRELDEARECCDASMMSITYQSAP